MKCFNCGEPMIERDTKLWECPTCGDITDEQYPQESPYEAKGFWTQTQDGIVGHVQGDPNMSEETLQAIHRLMKVAYDAIENGTLPKRKRGEK